MHNQNKQILFLCGREPAYQRNSLIQSILEQNFDTLSITSDSRRFIIRYISIVFRFLFFNKRKLDLVYVGFFGQPLIPVVRLLWKGPILFDAFLSVYDTLCFDRKWIAPGSLAGRLAFWIDQWSCSLADLVILDTQAHADYFHQTFQVPQEKLVVLYVGCDEAVFSPRPVQEEDNQVLFYGSFLPLQGVEVIIRAAAMLAGAGVAFKVIGAGIESRRIEQLVRQLGVKNITFTAWVPLDQLPDEIGRVAICLGGHFGTSDKARRVIAGKTFQCIAMGKATIVGDNAANRELLTHNQDAWFCEMGNPQALADSIQTLLANPERRTAIGHGARETFLRQASKHALSEQVVAFVVRLTEEMGD